MYPHSFFLNVIRKVHDDDPFKFPTTPTFIDWMFNLIHRKMHFSPVTSLLSWPQIQSILLTSFLGSGCLTGTHDECGGSRRHDHTVLGLFSYYLSEVCQFILPMQTSDKYYPNN